MSVGIEPMGEMVLLEMECPREDRIGTPLA